jgi:hypothetical protein
MISQFKNALCVLLLSLFSTSLFASGAFILKGQIKSFSDKEYQISTSGLVYRIKKENLAPAQITLLKEQKVGETVELAMTTDAIEDVNEDKPAAKTAKPK